MAWIRLATVALALGLVVPASAELKPQDLYKRALPSVVTLVVELRDGKAAGSGFLCLSDGFAVTANHVIRGAKSVTAHFAGGDELIVDGLVDADAEHDLALVHIRSAPRPLLKLRGDEPEVGSRVYAIGAPRGLEFTLSDGLVSGIRSIANEQRLLQFTSPISPGNSGGPLLDENGEVVGVVDAYRADAQNVNFAIPAAYALKLDARKPLKAWSDIPATVVPPASPAERPFDHKREIVAALLGLNAAVQSDDYEAFRRLWSGRLRGKFSANQAKRMFSDFRKRKIDLGLISNSTPEIESNIRSDDWISVIGHIETMGLSVMFRLVFQFEEGHWAIDGIGAVPRKR